MDNYLQFYVLRTQMSMVDIGDHGYPRTGFRQTGMKSPPHVIRAAMMILDITMADEHSYLALHNNEN